MDLIESVMLCMLLGLVGATAMAYRAENEPRDVRLLVGSPPCGAQARQ